MRMSENENKVVNDLVEEIMDELRGEGSAVQIKVAFAILAKVLTEGARREPEEMKRAAGELQELMNLHQ
jgi:hypothetical protein